MMLAFVVHLPKTSVSASAQEILIADAENKFETQQFYNIDVDATFEQKNNSLSPPENASELTEPSDSTKHGTAALANIHAGFAGNLTGPDSDAPSTETFDDALF